MSQVAFALTINSSLETRFVGPIGDTTPLTGLTTDAAGTTVFAVPIGNSTDPNVTAAGPMSNLAPVFLADQTHIFGNNSSGALTFGSTINGEAFD